MLVYLFLFFVTLLFNRFSEKRRSIFDSLFLFFFLVFYAAHSLYKYFFLLIYRYHDRFSISTQTIYDAVVRTYFFFFFFGSLNLGNIGCTHMFSRGPHAHTNLSFFWSLHFYLYFLYLYFFFHFLSASLFFKRLLFFVQFFPKHIYCILSRRSSFIQSVNFIFVFSMYLYLCCSVLTTKKKEFTKKN